MEKEKKEQPKKDLEEDVPTLANYTWEDVADNLIDVFGKENLETKLNGIKQIAPAYYIHPDEVKTRLVTLLKTCEKICVKINSNWCEDGDGCLYIRYNRHQLDDGTVNRDISFVLNVGWCFSGF